MHIEEKIRQTIDVEKVSASQGRGDFVFNNKYTEVKVSFLSAKTDSYSITHLRLWQQINFYLFCFIDCNDNFKPNFYLIDKNIINKLKLGFMNGTPEANINNQNVELRATVKVDSDNMKVIKKFNLLNDTSIKSLKEYLTK
jgi:penicillin-binding protein-related factor A (putative recombinase)